MAPLRADSLLIAALTTPSPMDPTRAQKILFYGHSADSVFMTPSRAKNLLLAALTI